ncbi:LADA_0B06084g1_1 [Lachancea dasiensis]|uniref:LADA_0B06084g1_1 n=1 Tax=Lachancea dasiensis TaxID=1072105 RepID=A0A1G4IU59_9SACH|nr:LADA_0B06084g1_1 [Lachancea dasiensis]
MTTECERQPLAKVSSSRMNKLNGNFSSGTLSKSSTTIKPPHASKLPSIKSMIHQDSETWPQPNSLEQRMVVQATTEAAPPKVDFDQVSQKLKIRMQYAYYKYRTRQTPVGLRECPTPRNSDEQDAVRSLRRSRPATRAHSSSSAHAISNTVCKPSRRLVMSQGSFRTPVKPNLWNPNPNAPGARTPLDPFDTNQQATPMSMKAAKSLIDLFSSNQ